MSLDLTPFLNKLEDNSNNLFHTIKGLSEEQLIRKSTDEDWSIYQILEHICLTDQLVFSLISTSSKYKSEQSELFGAEKINKLLVTGRSFKVQAPEVVFPKGSIKTLEAFKELFSGQRSDFQSAIDSGQLIIDNRTYKHPFLGVMTATDWLNFVISHTERHHEQIIDKLQ